MSDDMAMAEKTCSSYPRIRLRVIIACYVVRVPGVTNLRKGSIQGKDLLEISDARGGTEVTHGSLPVSADDVHNLSVINAFCLLQERENQLSYAIDALWNPERHLPRVQSIQVTLTIERAVKSAAGDER